MKGKRAENEVVQLLRDDGFDVQKCDASGAGKYDKGDMILRFCGRSYHIEVKRKEGLPIERLEKERAGSNVLIMRKNRGEWMVYLSLDDLICLALSHETTK